MPKRAVTLTLKVLTVNTHKGFTHFGRRFMLHELREAIRASHADVVFLQEVLGFHTHHARRVRKWPRTSQYEFLADSIWRDYAYGRNAVYPHGHHGNAVLSKFPIISHHNMDVSLGGHERRGLLHCILRPPKLGRELHVICVHLGLRETHRREQVKELCRLVERKVPRDAPLIIAGDFNDWRLRAQKALSRMPGLKEVFDDSVGRVARTFPARFPILRLDRIYVRGVKDFRPVFYYPKIWKVLSDHAPLAVDLDV
ncbi:MAG TPA: endonuclease/exonuclease/phosphatase family protein [Burkholderiaceae bacterium]|nr:endonuclease/exonuclease/phosphatase family protein [Burkholderiaceae bacterium]